MTKRLSHSPLFFVLCGLLAACSGSHQKENIKRSNDETWTPIGAGGGGAMFTPTISPHNEKVAFVSCDMTGSYVTYNKGESWRMFNLRGRAHYYVFDPIDSNVVYAHSLALFRSTDMGHTWNVVYPPVSDIQGIISKDDHASEILITKDSTRRSVAALAIDPSDSKKLYAVIVIQNEATFCVSDDWGASWRKEKVLEDKNAKNIFVVPSSPKDNRTIYVTGTNSIYAKENGTWRLNKGPEGVKQLTAYAGGYDTGKDKFVIYAVSGKSYFNPDGDRSGIHITEDGGATWHNMEPGLLGYQIKNAVLPEYKTVATSAGNPQVVYVSYSGLTVHKDTLYSGVARSEDYGKTWTLAWKDKSIDKTELGSENLTGGWLNDRFGPGWGDNPFAIGVAPRNADLCYATDFGRNIQTTDGGKTWDQVYTNKTGTGWATRGLEVTTSYNIVFDPFDTSHVFIAFTDIGLMESIDGGKSWNSATKNNGVPRTWQNSTYWLVFDPKVKNKLWAVMSGTHDLPRPKMWRKKGTDTYKGGVLTSNDGGKTWETISSDIGESAVTYIILDPESDPKQRTLYASAFGKGVFKSTDGGKSWVKKNNGVEGKEPFAWRIERRKDGVLFLIIARRGEHGETGADYEGALYRSDDGAESWTKIALPNGTNAPMSLCFDPANPRTFLLSVWGSENSKPFAPDTGGGIFLSADEGTTWKHVLSSDQHIHDVTVDERNHTFYACGFNGSAYRSPDKGVTWKRIQGYDFKWGKRVEPDPRDADRVFVITFGGGVWHGPAQGSKTLRGYIATPAFVR